MQFDHWTLQHSCWQPLPLRQAGWDLHRHAQDAGGEASRRCLGEPKCAVLPVVVHAGGMVETVPDSASPPAHSSCWVIT